MPTIRLDIEVDAAKGTAAIKQFAGEAEAATKKAGDAAKEGGKGFGQFASSLDETVHSLTELLTPANLLGTVIGVTVVESLRRAIDATVEYAHEMQRLQLVTGASLGSLGELQDAAEKLGIGSNRLQRAFFLLSTEIESGGRNLAKLGIATRDETGAQRESLDIIRLLSDKFRSMNDVTAEAVAARKALGRQAVTLLPLFTLEQQQLEEMGRSGREFAKQFGEEDVKASILLGGALAEVGQAMTRLRITVVSDLTPGIKAFADTLAWTIDLLHEVPKPIRVVVETLAAMATFAIGAALAVKALAVGFSAAGLTGVGAALTAWLGPIALVAAGLAALIILGPTFISWITSLIPQSVIDKWHTFTAAVSATYTQLKEFLGLQGQAKPEEAAKPAIDKEKTAQELATELSFDKRIIEAQLALYKAKHDTYDFEVRSSEVRQQLALRELAIERAKTAIPEEVAKLDQAETAIKAAGAAERVRIRQREQLDLLTIEEQTAEQYLALDASRRKAELAARTDAISQSKILVKQEYDAFGISHQQFVDETIRLNNLELSAKQTALDQEVKQVQATEKLKATQLIQQAKANNESAALYEEKVAKLHAETNVKLADLDAKRADDIRATANANTALIREITAEEYAFLAQAEDKDLARKIANLEAWKAAHADNVKAVMAADAGLFQTRVEGYNRDVKNAIDSELKKTTLYQDEGKKQLAIQTGIFDEIQKDRQKDIDDFSKAELQKTGILQDYAIRRVAMEAKAIRDVQALRQQVIDDSATVLEQQARQEGDYLKAFETGFAHAAQSAADGLKAMADAGRRTFDDLKSGLSDFLYEILSGSGKIGDVFANLGKRILRTFTDVFAEIIAKQALMAAGFSVTGMLGIGTATAGAALTSYEGSPNQAAQAVTQLGAAATGTSTAIAGMGQVSGVVSSVFGSLGTLLLNFGSVLLGVMQLMASLATGGAAGGGIGSAATNLMSTITSLGSAFGNLTSLLQGNLTNGLQSVFSALGGGEGGLFGTAEGSLGPAMMPGLAATFLGKAVPIAGALIGIALDFAHGQIGAGLGGVAGGAIGAIFGGPVGAAIGQQIGHFIGGFLDSILGGLFSGPSPEMSGMIRLNPTTVQAVASAGRAVKWDTGPGPNQVNNPPGRSNFSFLEVGPFYEEMYKHRTEGKLNREDSQIAVMNIVIGTLQAALKGVQSLIPTMPTQELSQALSARISSVLAAGFKITSFDLEGDSGGEVAQKFQDFLKGLSADTVKVFTSQVFPSVDLSALDAKDATKAFDALTAAMATLGSIAKAAGNAVDFSRVSLDDFAKGSVTFFQQFQKDGEAFIDTVKRIAQSFDGILTLQHDLQADVIALTGDTAAAIATLQQQFHDAEDSILHMADALTVLVESGGQPDEILKAAQQMKQAIDATLQAELQFVQRLKAAVDTLNKGITDGVDLVISLTQKIDAMRGTQLNEATFQFGLGGIVYLFNAIDDVTTRIALFSAGLVGAAENLDLFIANLPTAVNGFNMILDQIQHMTNPTEALAALKGLGAAVEAGLQAAIAAVNRETQARVAALTAEKTAIQQQTQDQITALNAEKAAIQNANAAQVTALNDQKAAMTKVYDTQKQALQTQLSLAQQWNGILASTKTQLTDLYNLLAPTHPLTSLNDVRGQFEAAFANFQAAPTPEGATQVQELAKQVLQLAQQTPGYNLASQAFQSLAAEVQASLKAVQDVAGSQPTQEQLQAKIAALDQQQVDALAKIDDQLKELDRQQTAHLAAIDLRLQALNASQTAQLAAIDQQIAAAQAAGQAQIQQFQNLAASGLEAIRSQVVDELRKLAVQQADAAKALQTVLGDKTFEQFVAEKQAEAVTALQGIDDTLRYYLGQILTKLFPGATISQPVSPAKLQEAVSGLSTLAQLAQGGGFTSLAQSLASASQAASVSNVPGVTGALSSATQTMAGLEYFQSGAGASFLSQLKEINTLTQQSQFVPAISRVTQLIESIHAAGIYTQAPVPGFAEGLPFVPYDNYVARLHYGERVLTASENASLSRGGDSSVTVNIGSGAVTVQVTGRESDADLRDKLDRALVQIISGPSLSKKALTDLAARATR